MRAPWEAEVCVDEALAGKLIATQFPGLGSPTLRRFGEGWDNVAFLVAERWVFRFPRRTISAELMATELRVLPAIAAHVSLRVPVPRFAGEPSDDFAWPFAGYERLPGEALSRSRLDEPGTARVARHVGGFLRELHGIRAAVPGLDVDRLGRLNHAKCMPKAMDRLGQLAEAGVIDGVAAYERTLEETAPPARANEPLVPVHGDLYGRHILVDESAACGVIDWGDVHRGDPAVDLAVAFESFPPSARDALAAAYGPIRERTWVSARYRGLYHAAMVAHYGLRIDDSEMLRAGINGLSWGLV